MTKYLFFSFFFFTFCTVTYSVGEQTSIDSLKNELNTAKDKAGIYNLLAELTIEDSLKLSKTYADSAFIFAIKEKNKNEVAKAYFNIAEVFSYGYNNDTTICYYKKALNIFKETGDNYYTSYTLNNLGYLMTVLDDYKQAIEYYENSLDYLDKETYPDDLAHVYINIGNAHHALGNYEIAIKNFRKARKLSDSIPDYYSLAIGFNGMGLAYKYLGNYDSAVYYYKKSLELNKKHFSPSDQAVNLSNIGALYYLWKKYDLALEYFNDALEIHINADSKNDISIALNNIGAVYRAKKEYQKALNCYEEGLAIDYETGREFNMSAKYNNMGDVYFEQTIYSKSIEYYNKSLVLNKKMGLKNNISVTLKNLGKAYYKIGDYDKARNYFEQSLEMANTINATTNIMIILQSLSELYEITGNFSKALNYHQQYTFLKDSIFNDKSQKALADMQAKYENEKISHQLNIANKENNIKQIRLNEQNKRAIFLIVGIIVLLFLSVLLVLQYRLKYKAYKKLVQKNREFVERNRKLLEDEDSHKAGNEKNGKNHIKGISEAVKSKLKNKLLNYIYEDKPYLNPELTINDMAHHLDTNAKYISQVINEEFNKNFNNFINEYRINLAIEYLTNGVKKRYSIEGISSKVGFHSKSTFNIAFKKCTGVTPSFYIKSLKKEIITNV